MTLELWSKVDKVPTNYLKQIAAGRMKGKSDINPQWRYKALTENFGICGIGWKYEVVRLWLEPGSNDQVCAFAEIKLYVNQSGAWSEAIPGIGGSMLIAKESSGLYTSDEAYKMAITDALSVACKMLGIGSAIYEGLWDGSTYKGAPANKPAEVTKPVTKSEPVAQQPSAPKVEATPEQVTKPAQQELPTGSNKPKITEQPAAWATMSRSAQLGFNKQFNTNFEVKVA